jgi:hypothetical protein
MQGLQLTLELLVGPSRALVSSALVGVGVPLAASALNPALCFTFRAPYDDDVFKARTLAPMWIALQAYILAYLLKPERFAV